MGGLMLPTLLVDVDGPLNPFAAKPHRRPAGYETHRLLTPRWEAAERRRLTEWGLPNKRMKPLRVWLNPDHGPALEALPFDLVWATTWEEEANTYVAPVLGLPELPFIAWPSPRPVPAGDVFWKTPEIVTWAQGRAFAWIDDEITEADRTWVGEHHMGPALLHRVDPRYGLTLDDFAALTTWATALD
ncbi:hypothetical protein [Streptomyces albidochromogenes]|uniref:hypothetical protein n=1 Tax=Streptomyces albidochromogenes TaxID=329524 RepID=UPI001ABF19FC|nr:hypothetical protein [Streptomyces albidochromogenes]